MRRIAFVVQRYGSGIHGGAEEHCRQVAERLAGRFEVEVFTTCARDYLTWANEHPPGTEVVGGVPVHRFPVARPRAVRSFGRFSQRVLDRPHRFRDEAEWMERQGPDAPALVEELGRRRGDHDLFFFFTYLYAHTYFGLPRVARKAVLLPTAHDEPPIRLGLFRHLFLLPRGFIYNTPEERAFVQGAFDNAHIPSVVGGMGVDLPALSADRPPPGDYLLYLGRVDVEKGCRELVDMARGLGGPAPRLVLAGQVKMRLPSDARVEVLGPVDEARKRELLAGALALVVPSRYESLSLVALEAWAAGTPVLANGASEVLSGHIARGGGGWLYRDGAGFGEAVALIRADRAERDRRGAAGRAYVESAYTWERTIETYAAFLERICALAENDGADRD